jgi:hypothetical protein
MSRLAGAPRAAISGDDPFLFHRERHDWRWVPFRAVEERIAAAAGAPPAWHADPLGAAIAALRDSPDGDAGDRLLAELPPSRRRDILVLDRPPGESRGRQLLGWAAAAGAAVLLEPESDRTAATVAWARPTVVAGSVAELTALGERLLVLGSPARLHRRRAPLGRLRAVVVLGPSEGPLPEPWVSIGVRSVFIP